MKQFYINPYSISLDFMELVERSTFNIDAITLIVEQDGDIAQMKEIWEVYRKKANLDGYKISPFRSHGYEGASISSVRYSYNKKSNRAMFQITGRETPQALVELIELDGYSTRIDLQATFQVSQPVPELAKLIHEARVYRGGTKQVRLQDYTYISGSEGDTLYVGNRASNMMLRIYDKSFEYNLPRGTIWRWEIQYNKEAAMMVWKDLDGLERNEVLFKAYIQDKLFKDCYKKGVRLPVEYGYAESTSYPELGKKQPDRERYLKWLRETVSPVVKWFVSAGEQEMVLEALGIQSLKFQIESGDNILAVVTEITGEIVSRETISGQRVDNVDENC